MTTSPVTTGARCCCAALLFAVCLVVFSGCDDASRRASARLRTQVHDLRQDLDASQLRIAELESQLLLTSTNLGLDGVALANTPRVAELGISSFSGMRRDDGETSTIELYVSAVDGLRRPLQLVGTLEAKVVHLPMDGDPVVLGHLRMDPSEVRDAWRRGLDGTSYLMTVPLTAPVPPDTRVLHAQVLHHDARTDLPHEASLDIRPTPSNEE